MTRTGRYLLLLLVFAIAIGPFLWQLSTSLKGVGEDIYSNPPQFLPADPPLSTASVRHAEYQVELAAGWAADPTRPVWLQEVGAPTPHIPVQLLGDFAEQTVRNVLTCPNLWGVTWWCSHDVSRELADFPELEYSLGLLTSDRSVKPMARRIASAMREGHQPEPRTTALVLDVGDEHTAPGRSACAPGGAFFDAWMTLADKGVRAAVVLASQVSETGYLAARGITDLIDGRELQTYAR